MSGRPSWASSRPASVGNVSSDTVVQGAQFDGGLRQGQASLDHLEGMGVLAKDGKLVTQNDLLGIRQEARFGQLGTGPDPPTHCRQRAGSVLIMLPK